MQTSRILTLAAAVIGLSTIAASAADVKAQSSTRGRSGFVTVFVAETPKTTIALSRQGQGIGSDARERAEKPKAKWHNPSRGFITSAAVVSQKD